MCVDSFSIQMCDTYRYYLSHTTVIFSALQIFYYVGKILFIEHTYVGKQLLYLRSY